MASSDLCVLVGGGPSLRSFDWSLLDNHFVIAINKAYQVLPNAQMIYFTDNDYMQREWDAMFKHGGMMVRGAINPQSEPQNPRLMYYRLITQLGFVTQPGCLAHGNNSGYAALNLAGGHLGFKKIALLGFDLKWDGKNSHWHGGHDRTDTDDSMKRWAVHYDYLAAPLEAIGCKVWNVNPDSGIKCFEQVPLSWMEEHRG